MALWGAICLTVLYVFLFLALWAYKELVGLSLVGLAILAVVVFLKGRLNEQQLRRSRYQYHQEIPLDGYGEPYYWPAGAQENPNHTTFSASRPREAAYYEGGYQRQG